MWVEQLWGTANTSRCVINDLDEYVYIYSEIPVPSGASCLLHVHKEVKSESDVKIKYYWSSQCSIFFQYIWIWWSNSFPAAGRLAFWTKDWKLSDICSFSALSTASWGIAKLKTEGSYLNSSSLKHFHIYPHSNYAHCEWCFCSSSLFFVWTVTVVTVKVNKHLCSFSFWILLSGGLGRGSSDLPRILQIFCLSDSIYLTGCSYTSPEWIANS